MTQTKTMLLSSLEVTKLTGQFFSVSFVLGYMWHHSLFHVAENVIGIGCKSCHSSILYMYWRCFETFDVNFCIIFPVSTHLGLETVFYRSVAFRL